MDLRQIQRVFFDKCKIEENKPLIVGISGGADSLCLLFLLSSLRVPVVSAYFDHRLRPESGQEAAIVARFSAQAGCDFIAGEGDVRELARKEGLSIEAAARKARYTFLFEQARLIGAQAVAVGHTADDQVETILLHLLRGSGLDGLKGMSYRSVLPVYSENIPLIRPLIGVWHTETVAYCAERGLTPLEDSTNQDQRYFRNRLRHRLIPELESYNPAFKKRLWTLGQVAQVSLGATDKMIEWVYCRCLMQASAGKFVVLNSNSLLELDDGSLAKIIRVAVQHIHPEPANLDHKAIQRAVHLLRRPEPSGQVDLTANLIVIKVHGRVYVADKRYLLPTSEWPQILAGDALELNLPGSTRLSSGWWVVASYRNFEPGDAIPADPGEAWLDWRAVNLPLVVRAWQPGDRFQPIGMRGSIKLADFFVNQKIPRIARAGWPLVITDGEIAWVVGLRIGEKYRLKSDSRKVICLKLERE